MKILRMFGVLLLALAVVVLIVLAMGSRLPHAHVATASVNVLAPQAKVWGLIEDIDSQPTWRPGLKAIEAMPAENGHRCWSEVQNGMKMPLCEDMVAAPSTRIVRIADPKLAFGGTWTYQLTPIDANSTNVLITENGTTGPALWRFMDHYVMHEDSMIKEYEVALKKRAEEQ